MSKFFIRPSQIVKADECMYAMMLQYILNIKPTSTSANLIFGTIVHEAITKYLAATFAGMPFDAEKHFLFKWQEAIETLVIAYNATVGPNDLMSIGQKLCGDFPAYWDRSGFMPLIDEKGPVLERKFEVEILPGIVLTGTPDIIAMNVDGEVFVLDFKTPASASPEEFYLIADQLTCYQILAEGNRETLGIEQIDGLGYVELIKKKIPKTSKGSGPIIVPPATGPRRTDKAVANFITKVGWMVEDIQRERFVKKPRMAYNNPCGLCDYQGLCHKGDCEGLIIPAKCSIDLMELAA